jgi:hypothetical protein
MICSGVAQTQRGKAGVVVFVDGKYGYKMCHYVKVNQ